MNTQTPIDRRTALRALSALAACGATSVLQSANAADEAPPKTGLGLVIYDCRFRRDWLQQRKPEFDLYEPLNFLEHCRQLGAGGMQARLGVLDAKQAGRIREFAAEHSLFIDAIVSPPGDKEDVARFEAEIKTAADVGVQAVRTVIMPGRRYERFSSLEEFRDYERRGRKMVELAVPVVEKHRVPLAIENHKGQRNDERVALFEGIDSEFVGACVDTGNSFALLEDPIETIEVLAPWAKSVHLKDQAVQEYEDGFFLGDIPLGEGCFDLPQMVQILRKAQPRIQFALELITRDALKVPCLTQQYFAAFSHVPAADLARTLRIVRRHPAKALQQVTSLQPDAQVKLEDANVAASLNYARETLNL